MTREVVREEQRDGFRKIREGQRDELRKIREVRDNGFASKTEAKDRQTTERTDEMTSARPSNKFDVLNLTERGLERR